jgi:sugar O-acyltransferase (sialic acid O-acetyltransferase NeuD family)
MKNNITYIVGCGGHGRVILDILRSAAGPFGLEDNVFFLDDNKSLWNGVIDGVPVAGGPGVAVEGSRVLLGIGDNMGRRDLYHSLKDRGCLFPRLIAPSAVLSASARIEEGTVIFARAVVQTGAHIGANAVINTAAIVEHDCRIHDHAQLAPAVALSGNVFVGEGTLLGTGVCVNKNVRIGEYCLVSPGLPVIKDVPDHSVYKFDTSGILVEKNYRVAGIGSRNKTREPVA